LDGVIVLIGDARALAADILDLSRDGAVLIVAGSLVEAAHRLTALSPSLPFPTTSNDGERLGARSEAHQGTLEGFSDLDVNLAEHRMFWRGRELDLTAHEFRLLQCLASQRRAWSFAELSQETCGVSYLGDPGPLHSAVKRLRRKLLAAQAGFDIRSVRGIGFLLVETSQPSPARTPVSST
jgi:DNA-binding response OmpR family regulator